MRKGTDAMTDTSPSHPFTLASASLFRCNQAAAEHASIEELVAELSAAMIADGIPSIADSGLMLATQARVLDSIFNRLIMSAFKQPSCYSEDALRLAFMAQRQSAHTIDKLKKHDPRRKDNGEKIKNSRNRTEGDEKWKR